MNHILKKLAIAGGGGKNKPKPPIYKPPILGELQYGSSFSFAETIDLISDGPIEGIVDRHGRLLEGLRILQGIYLDDTVVAVSNKPFDATLNDREEEAATNLNMELNSVDGTGIKNCKKFFEELGEAPNRSAGARVTSLNIAPDGDPNPINQYEDAVWPNCPLYFTKRYRDVTWRGNAGNSYQQVEEWFDWGLFDVRAFIRNRTPSSEVTFPWFLNNDLQTTEGISDANALFQRGPAEVGRRRGGGEDVPQGAAREWLPEHHQDLFWTDNNETEAANLMLALYSNDYWPTSLERVQEFVQDELDELLLLWNENQTDTPDVPKNTLQAALAEKALSRIGWLGSVNDDPTTSLIERLIGVPGDQGDYLVVVVKVNETGNTELLSKNIAVGEDKILQSMVTRPYGSDTGWALESELQGEGVKIFDATCPTIESDGKLSGDMKGFVLMKIPLKVDQVIGTAGELDHRWNNDDNANEPVVVGRVFSIHQRIWGLLKDIESFKYSKTLIPESLLGQYGLTDLKFNYTNLLAEFRKGEEFQNPLNYFRTVFIDHVYGRDLFGPFNADRKAAGTITRTNTGERKGNDEDNDDPQRNAPQRIAGNRQMLTRSEVVDIGGQNFNLAMDGDLPVNEGSDDERINNQDEGDRITNYSDWAEGNLVNWNEAAVSVVHTVYNPNVTRAFISLNVLGLSDTLTWKQTKVAPEDETLDLASKFPTVLNLRVETGTLGTNTDGTEGLEVPYRSYTYRIVALIEGSTIIDIGNPDYRGDSSREFVINIDGGDESLNAGFALPPTITNKQVILSVGGEHGIEAGTIDQDSTEKRYVKVTKLSFETNSVLLAKSVELQKVTEIIDVPLPYPFSAIVGTRLDSRSFSAIPRRTYDCKLKKVRVPTNYFPVKENGKDKRYFDNQTEFDAETKENKSVYEGDWDGTFKDQLEWSDNPAWILYDLLVNERYGMGSHINADTINIWELYRIGRFCDAVDDAGYFKGVSDGRGGKEPRFSCNIVFDQGQKIFDAINTIAALFRGRVFFSNSSINFVDDRPRNPVNLFTNENVKDGLFFYSNNRRDEQFNCIEVAFRDRFDNFSPQIEVVENEDNIKEKGIFKKRIEGIGITSRAMARRVAQHQIFSKITENQQVAFTAGLETLLCQPGDLVFIEDDLKTNRANFGKVLDVDINNEIMRVSNTFVNADMTGVLTVMNPTGRDTSKYIQTGFAELNRTRYEQLQITGDMSNTDALITGAVVWHRYTGDYNFSGYTAGYPEASGRGPAQADPRYQQYALYTGLPQSGTILYYENTISGWVFASGGADIALGDFISTVTGAQTLAQVGRRGISDVDLSKTDGRGTTGFGFTGFDPAGYITARRGVVASELDAIRPDQLTILNVTGSIFSTPSQLQAAGYNNYGSVLSGFDKPEVLPFIKLGSPSKFEITDASPFIYKVVAMKEENVNEYLITATKYETGKFKLIEDNISIEEKANTFSYQAAQTVNKVTYQTLSAPTIVSLTTGEPSVTYDTFTISGVWSGVANSTGYNVILTRPNGSEMETTVTTTGHQFEGLSNVGMFNYSVNALGRDTQKSDTANAYFDSQYDSSGIFVLYDNLLPYTFTFINRITIN